MTDKSLTGLLEKNIRQAIDDYRAHTSETEVMDNVSDGFVNRLATDAANAKADLRELLRKSPAWDEELQAVVINGTRTHEPDYFRIRMLARTILKPYTDEHGSNEDFYTMMNYFEQVDSELDKDCLKMYIQAINNFAPNAYRKGRKKSRIFKTICDELGVTDLSKGSEFQKLFAEFADEINGKKIDFKLFLSINPAHFLTMSNPDDDFRGEMLTSCHTFNNKGGQYNNGCSGYARDNVTMIAFTVADPDIPETLNNRKTTRQLFMYRPYNGLLLQSRMYNSSGGTYGKQKESKVYRDLVQREITACENVPNLWKTFKYCGNEYGIELNKGEGFGGYCDWQYEDFDAQISIRLDKLDSFENFEIGTYGLCVSCAEEITQGVICDDCNEDIVECADCGAFCDSEDMFDVYDAFGDQTQVCCTCFEAYYEQCPHCHEAYRRDNMTEVSGEYYVCEDCLQDRYAQCDDCGEWIPCDDIFYIDGDYYEPRSVCPYCFESGNYESCHDCGSLYHDDDLNTVEDENGNEIEVCDYCLQHNHANCVRNDDDVVNDSAV